MPDIDIDFDEDGRESVLKYVVNKYGHDKVAHIITFGSMAAKMAIRDVARVQKYLCRMQTGSQSLFLKDRVYT